jgi:hypothetical protein
MSVTEGSDVPKSDLRRLLESLIDLRNGIEAGPMLNAYVEMLTPCIFDGTTVIICKLWWDDDPDDHLWKKWPEIKKAICEHYPNKEDDVTGLIMDGIELNYFDIRDLMMRLVRPYPNLKYLSLENTQIANDSAKYLLKHFINLHKLECLNLKNNNISENTKKICKAHWDKEQNYMHHDDTTLLNWKDTYKLYL